MFANESLGNSSTRDTDEDHVWLLYIQGYSETDITEQLLRQQQKQQQFFLIADLISHN